MAKRLPKVLSDYILIQNDLVRSLKENPILDIATAKYSIGFHADDIDDFTKTFILPIIEIINNDKKRHDFFINHFTLVNSDDHYPDWKYVEDLEIFERNKLISDLSYYNHLNKLNGEDDFTRRNVFGGNCLTTCQIGLVKADYIPNTIETEIWADFFFRSTNVNDTLIIDLNTCFKILIWYQTVILRHDLSSNKYPINMTIDLSRAHVFRKQPQIWRKNNC